MSNLDLNRADPRLLATLGRYAPAAGAAPAPPLPPSPSPSPSPTPGTGTGGSATGPMTLIGLVMAGGVPVAGATVRAYVGGLECGSAVTWAGSAFNVNLQVLGAGQRPGCGTDGAAVTFTVDGQPATPAVTFSSGSTVQVGIAAP